MPQSGKLLIIMVVSGRGRCRPLWHYLCQTIGSLHSKTLGKALILGRRHGHSSGPICAQVMEETLCPIYARQASAVCIGWSHLAQCVSCRLVTSLLNRNVIPQPLTLHTHNESNCADETKAAAGVMWRPQNPSQ